MYSVKEINGECYVIHDATGTTLPYRPRRIKYDDVVVPDWKREYFHFWIECMTEKQRKKVKKDSMAITYDQRDISNYIELAPLSTTTVQPVKCPSKWKAGTLWCEEPTKQEGNKPMATRFNEVYANAVIAAPTSDTATQRDYLLSRLSNAAYPKYNELDKLFHRFVDNTPKTYKDLIDAIKNDKFTIDAKIAKRVDAAADAERDEDECNYNYRGPFYGIVWAGDQFDDKAWLAARNESEKQQRAAKDIIMTGDAAAGLAALQAFEAWLPTKETTPVQ